MNHDVIKHLLDEYVDGELVADQSREVAAHLGVCADCREEVARITALASPAAELSREQFPDRDLWPGIASALENRPHHETRPAHAAGSRKILPFRRLRGQGVAALLATAAVLVVIIGVWQHDGGRMNSLADRMQPQEETDLATTAMINALDAATRADHREVATWATYDGSDENTMTFTALHRDLEQIDQAINDLQQAWLADTGNQHLARRLAAACQARAQLQKKTNELSVIL